jgi:16S rRNA (cytosine967-C5)-methyltransferase
LAFDVLREVTGAGAYANLALSQSLDRAHLSDRDAALVTELVAGTCRALGTYDRIVEAASGRSLKTLQPAVVDLLRLGCHQVLALRLPTAIAVSSTVDLAAATVGRRITGLVNAVLRRVGERDWPGWLDALAAGQASPTALAIRTCHPEWIVEAYVERLGLAEAEIALAANNVAPTTTLAVRPGLATAADLMARGARPATWSAYAVTITGDPRLYPEIGDGRAGVEDEGSQLVALGLARAGSLSGISAGEIGPEADDGWPDRVGRGSGNPALHRGVGSDGPWLDLCAGPGGKTALLAGLAAAQGDIVVANELAPHRARLVAQATRAYPRPPAVVVADGRRPPWRPGSFGRVLADVPCSGLGALRRRPEARWRKRAEDIPGLAALQRDLLLAAVDACRTGGVIAYATCSPHVAETVEVVDAVLAERPDLAVIPAAQIWPEVPDSTVGPYLQLWPHRHGTDAMFAAYLQRRGPA